MSTTSKGYDYLHEQMRYHMSEDGSSEVEAKIWAIEDILFGMLETDFLSPEQRKLITQTFELTHGIGV